MGQSYVNLRYHIVFGTRGRQPWLLPEKRDRFYRFFAYIASKSQAPPPAHHRPGGGAVVL